VCVSEQKSPSPSPTMAVNKGSKHEHPTMGMAAAIPSSTSGDESAQLAWPGRHRGKSYLVALGRTSHAPRRTS